MRVASAHGRIEEGEVIGGRYRVTGLLGEGGFGTVYDCVHVTTGHPVAVKVLGDRAGSEADEMNRRFFQEAATTSRLSHPNTVRVFDFGETDGGQLFLAMERLDGETLQEVLAANQRAGRAMPDVEAAALGIAVLRSLGEAHAHGLVHRDMKPANIFLHEIAGGDRIVKVLDFGIVKDVDASMTQAGKALGTPTHMSPEQAMGTPVDARSDLYALGVVLYECVTGQLPFYADNPLTIVMQHVTEPLVPIAQRAPSLIRPAVAAVIERALEKMPDARWADAHEMRAALQRAIQQVPTATFEALGARADREEFKSTSPSVPSPRSLPPRGGTPARPTRLHAGQPSSIRVNIPGVRPVQVRTGEQRIYARDEDEATAIGVPAMEQTSPPPVATAGAADNAAGSRLDLGVDAPTQVLDADQLRRMSESDAYDLNAPPPPIPPPPPVPPPPSPRPATPPSPRPRPAKPRPARSRPASPRRARPPSPGPPPRKPPPPPKRPDAAVLTVGEPTPAAEEPDQAEGPEMAPSPMDFIDRYERNRPPRPSFARGPSSMPDIADLMRAAGMVGGAGGRSVFAPGDVLGARLSADLRRMTAQLRDRTEAVPSPRRAALAALWIGPDATTAIWGTGEGEVQLVHPADVTETPLPLSTAGGHIEVGHHDDLIAGIVATTDGRYVVSASVDGIVRCSSPADGRRVGEVDVQALVAAIAVSTDGRLCVVGTDEGRLHLCRMPELTVRRVIDGHGGGVTAVDAASSRRLLASGGRGGVVRTWDPVGGGARLTRRVHDAPVGAIAISRDRRLIASGGRDGRLVLLSARDGEVLHEHRAHGEAISGLAFCADGEFIASIGDDRKASIRRVEDGRMISEREDFEAAPEGLRFAADNSCVYVGARDGTLRRLVILPLL